MRMHWQMGLVGAWALALGAVMPAVAYQRNTQMPAPRPDYPAQQNNTNIIPMRTTPIEDSSSMMREMEEKRGKAMISERQRTMVKEANQLVQAAAELQAGVEHGVDGAAREEQAKRAEAIEKLARNVKDRMKGMR